MSCSISMTAEEKKVAKKYAQVHKISLSEAFRNALFEKIEDEHDRKIFEEYEKEKVKGNIETYTHEEICRRYGI